MRDKTKIKIWYKTKNNQIKQFLLEVYDIEPNPDGRTIYVIGNSKVYDSSFELIIRVFKIENITNIEILDEKYVFDKTFSVDNYFHDSWHIWHSDTPPLEVKLHFSERVASRVIQTRWHSSQELEVLKDGSVIWTAKIANTMEMTYWILGWGAEVEVLSPNDLREHILYQAISILKNYE